MFGKLRSKLQNEHYDYYHMSPVAGVEGCKSGPESCQYKNQRNDDGQIVPHCSTMEEMLEYAEAEGRKWNRRYGFVSNQHGGQWNREPGPYGSPVPIYGPHEINAQIAHDNFMKAFNPRNYGITDPESSFVKKLLLLKEYCLNSDRVFNENQSNGKEPPKRAFSPNYLKTFQKENPRDWAAYEIEERHFREDCQSGTLQAAFQGYKGACFTEQDLDYHLAAFAEHKTWNWDREKALLMKKTRKAGQVWDEEAWQAAKKAEEAAKAPLVYKPQTEEEKAYFDKVNAGSKSSAKGGKKGAGRTFEKTEKAPCPTGDNLEFSGTVLEIKEITHPKYGKQTQFIVNDDRGFRLVGNGTYSMINKLKVGDKFSARGTIVAKSENMGFFRTVTDFYKFDLSAFNEDI